MGLKWILNHQLPLTDLLRCKNEPSWVVAQILTTIQREGYVSAGPPDWLQQVTWRRKFPMDSEEDMGGVHPLATIIARENSFFCISYLARITGRSLWKRLGRKEVGLLTCWRVLESRNYACWGFSGDCKALGEIW